MGYTTVYAIRIYASPKRKVEIMKQIAVAASRPFDKEAAYNVFKNEIDEVEKNKNKKYVTVSFEMKWWDPIRDFRGGWYNKDFDMPHEDGIGRVEDGIKLKKGEKLKFDCQGDADDDFWKATVKHNSFTYQHCDRVEYHNKRDECDNCDGKYEKCDGCSGCADLVPIYE